jgi:hypothetical protein
VGTQVEQDPSKNISVRERRYISHALVEIRKFKHWPFGIKSAVLLDISLNGFKMEYTSEVTSKPGELIWLNIPLNPVGIFSPSHLMIRGECRWFDKSRFRVGGIFLELTKSDKMIVEQIVETVRSRNAT